MMTPRPEMIRRRGSVITKTKNAFVMSGDGYSSQRTGTSYSKINNCYLTHICRDYDVYKGESGVGYIPTTDHPVTALTIAQMGPFHDGKPRIKPNQKKYCWYTQAGYKSPECHGAFIRGVVEVGHNTLRWWEGRPIQDIFELVRRDRGEI